jgi:hypothetical protein
MSIFDLIATKKKQRKSRRKGRQKKKGEVQVGSDKGRREGYWAQFEPSLLAKRVLYME